MFCSNCGNKIESDSKFCSSCGNATNQQSLVDDSKKGDNAILKTACVITAIIESIVVFMLGIMVTPFVLTVSTLDGSSIIYSIILILLFTVVPIFLIIFNIKNVIKVNKTSVIIISIVESVCFLFTAQVILLPLPIFKLIVACISKKI